MAKKKKIIELKKKIKAPETDPSKMNEKEFRVWVIERLSTGMKDR